jgi:hypothetical protein
MKEKNVCIFMAIVAISAFSSCKKKETEQPKKVVKDVFHIKQVRLDNQFVTNGKHFFQIYDGKKVGFFVDSLVYRHYNKIDPVPPDSAVYFDLYYISYQVPGQYNNNDIFVISSGDDSNYSIEYPKEKRFYPKGDKVTFYEVPSTFSYANFDTIKTGLDIPRLLREECVEHNPLNNGVYNAITITDGFGWPKNTIIGFKNSGRYPKTGLIKILETPTGSAKTKTPGSVKLEIKFIKE